MINTIKPENCSKNDTFMYEIWDFKNLFWMPLKHWGSDLIAFFSPNRALNSLLFGTKYIKIE